MAQRDAEMSEVIVVLAKEYEDRLQEGLDLLKAAGMLIDHADDDNSVIEGTCATSLLPTLRGMSMVKYVRVGVTWWADYPAGDPRDVNHPVIRPATVRDAERLLLHVESLAIESSDWIPLQPGEFNVTLEEERKILADYIAARNSQFLIAELDDKIIGACNASGGKRAANAHCATIGISVRKAHQHKGVGTQLLQSIIDWAKTSGVIHRLDLKVYADNVNAIALYEKFGFKKEGLRRSAILRNGLLIDDYEMSLVW